MSYQQTFCKEIFSCAESMCRQSLLPICVCAQSEQLQATLTGALPLSKFRDKSNISLKRASALVSSCWLLGLRSGGRGQGNHDVIEDNVPARILEVGRLMVEAPLRWVKLRCGSAVCGRAPEASSASSDISSKPVGLSTESCFEVVGDATRVIAG